MASVSDPRTRKAAAAARAPPRDFLAHLEAYLARRDGVDKLLKISRYAARLALAAGPPLPPAASARLKSFESSVGLSRKAFRLGKFVQDVNAFRAAAAAPPLVLLAYGGEGVYYFLEQFVWLAKAGLLPAHLLPRLQRLSAWAELLGYVGSITIKLKEMAKMESSIKTLRLNKEVRGEEEDEALRTLQGKLLLKRLSVVQDVADAFMALGDVTDGKGLLGSSTLTASAGLLSALISTHKNWNSC
ncbi:peroxisomal membrane protein 11-3 [Lolium perenne]|uniref:peroxisomal membrane protein 11-3 n=1 Tax=Lolium perenne TaxID=4522 RepID=UPI0021EA5754|nr:peroxisomal membrane protein 11-3 [Lolium perenne]XP_051181632.1 peroxisomal membrane protein 11-3 [Lolium perenne]